MNLDMGARDFRHCGLCLTCANATMRHDGVPNGCVARLPWNLPRFECESYVRVFTGNGLRGTRGPIARHKR